MIVSMKSSGALAEKGRTGGSLIFSYHDYRAFLKDWLNFMKASQNLSLRKFAEQTAISPAYISMILSGSRNLSKESFSKLLPVMKLDPSEKTYFELLISISDSESQEKR